MVLQQMQMLDQEVAAALAVPEQFAQLSEGGGIDLPALRMIRAPPSARAGVNAAVVGGCRGHQDCGPRYLLSLQA